MIGLALIAAERLRRRRARMLRTASVEVFCGTLAQIREYYEMVGSFALLTIPGVADRYELMRQIGEGRDAVWVRTGNEVLCLGSLCLVGTAEVLGLAVAAALATATSEPTTPTDPPGAIDADPSRNQQEIEADSRGGHVQGRAGRTTTVRGPGDQ